MKIEFDRIIPLLGTPLQSFTCIDIDWRMLFIDPNNEDTINIVNKRLTEPPQIPLIEKLKKHRVIVIDHEGISRQPDELRELYSHYTLINDGEKVTEYDSYNMIEITYKLATYTCRTTPYVSPEESDARIREEIRLNGDPTGWLTYALDH